MGQLGVHAHHVGADYQAAGQRDRAARHGVADGGVVVKMCEPHEAREDTVIFPPPSGRSSPLPNSPTSGCTSPAWSASSSAGMSSAR